jgi:hypothetical protein
MKKGKGMRAELNVLVDDIDLLLIIIIVDAFPYVLIVKRKCC